MPDQTIIIDTDWEVAQRLAPNLDLFLPEGGEKNWLPAQVPGHVHTDLVKAGVIGDPFYRMQELGCQWVDEADWTYRTTFAVSAERLASRGASGRHFLHFGGLDTICRVFLNGAQIGQAENFFTAHRFDVTEALREGTNELRVEFDSALRVGRERSQAYLGDGTSERGKQSYFNFGPRAFVRKPQYMFGWDWGPELVSCGLWQAVQLVTVPHAEIVDWRMEYDFIRPNVVTIRLKITVEKYDETPLTVGASLFTAGDNTPDAPIPDAPGRHTVNLTVRQQRVVRWDVNGSGGAQKRYLLNLKAWKTPTREERADENFAPEIVAHKGVSVGFRTVELIREPDADGKGESFGFRINGRDTFIKGANWIPDGCFPGNITDAQLRERLTQARDAHFNMVRVWGGGLYETETFYNLCDELGLLVWQDFAFACSMYPDDLPEFNAQVVAEATENVRRIRHRACLALWCGGNENMELAQGRWAGKTQATRFFGDRTIHEILPAVLAEEDTRTPYWPNSPYGGDNVTSEDFGDSHYWNVWHAKTPESDGDWKNYALSTSRFSSEFGFASPASRAAWQSVLRHYPVVYPVPDIPNDWKARSLACRWHDKTRKGYDTYLGFIAKHFPALVETEYGNLDDLIYYGQMNQADALTFGVEHYRRNRARCGGTLFWQLNDCWPTHSWAVIDSKGEPKAAYYAARRFYTPLLLSIVEVEGTIEAHLINDDNDAKQGQLTLRLRYFDGQDAAPSVEIQTGVGANAASGAVARLVLPSNIAREEVFAHAVFTTAENGSQAEKVLLVAEPKDLRLSNPELSFTYEADPNGDPSCVIAHISAKSLAAYVWIFRPNGFQSPLGLSDNGFHLVPGQMKTISISGFQKNAVWYASFAGLTVRHLQSRHNTFPIANYKGPRPPENATFATSDEAPPPLPDEPSFYDETDDEA